ncbi:MAG: hypothetical protein GY696_08680 [Gammaproteobacteria bacterium]|nr:hypothetical protein [Gammaproteobacteria bacterium]
MIQSSQQVWSAASGPTLIQFGGWALRARCEPERSEGERSEAEDRSPPSQLDSDKFGDEAARPNRWLDCIMH